MPGCLSAFGTTVWTGKGSKDAMKQYSNTIDAKCELQANDPDSGFRQFMCFPDWPTAWKNLACLKGLNRHVYELLSCGKPVKPYLDLEIEPGLPDGWTQDTVITQGTQLIQRIFVEYGVPNLPADSFVWTDSSTPTKFSMHLVISTHNPQLVYASNHQDDPGGAYQLAARLHELDPAGLGRLVDLAVYTKDREMRMVGSCKFMKTAILKTLEDKPLADAVITWLDDDISVIRVPCSIPRALKRRKQSARSVREHVNERILAAREDPDLTRRRMLDLIKAKVYHSAEWDPSHGAEDPFDRNLGVSFTHTDRSEVCYTGHVHEGCQNMRAWVEDTGDVWLQCFSHSCKTPYHLGRIQEVEKPLPAVRVRMEYITRDADLGRPGTLKACLQKGAREDSSTFNTVVQRWINGKFPCLNIKSPMGTGKTTFLREVLAEMRPASVLVVTYRVSLARELVNKLGAGFVSYDDIDPGAEPNLDDETAFPFVIVQVDSLPRLCPWVVRRFDLVVMDEVLSTLRHFSAATLRKATVVQATLNTLLQTAGRVLAMDALFNSDCWTFFERLSLAQKLIVNEYRSAPRTFEWRKDEAACLAHMKHDLLAGMNLVVACMSTNALDKIKTALVAEGAVQSHEVLVHTSKSDDDLRRKLASVNELWVSYRMVLYSPTIEAGVDFSAQHFDRLYVFCCLGSTSPHALVQMTGRVRTLNNDVVICNAAPSISLRASPLPVTTEQMLEYAIWVDQQAKQAFPPVLTKLQGGQSTLLPPNSADLWLYAANEAARLNGQSRFFLEVKEMLEGQGHIVRLHSSEEDSLQPVAPAEGSMHKEQLLAAADLTAEEYEAVRRRLFARKATAADKWAECRHQYKQAWGLHTLDEAFVDTNGTQAGSQKVALLRRILHPDCCAYELSDAHRTPAFQAGLLRAAYVQQVVEVLGLKGPLDTETQIHSLQPVLETPLAKDWGNIVRLFDRRSKRAGCSALEQDAKAIGECVKMVLGAVGLQLTKQVRRPRTAQGQTKVCTWSLDADVVSHMSDLVKLRQGQGAETRWAHLC